MRLIPVGSPDPIYITCLPPAAADPKTQTEYIDRMVQS